MRCDTVGVPHPAAVNAQVHEVQKWAGSFRDQNTPTLLLDPSPMPGSLLVVTYGGRDHTGDKTPDGYQVAAQVDGAGIYYRVATGSETSVTLSAGTTPPGTGRARVVAVEYASSIGWPFDPLDGAATGTESTSPASAGTAFSERSVRALVVAVWGSESALADRNYGNLTEVDYGQTAPSPAVIPEGVILGWPSTVGSIPSGWSRQTALDSRYLKGIPTSGTAPGSNGGAASHSHTTPGHVHGINHAHTQSAGSTGSTSTSQNFGGTGTGAGTTHTHPLPTANTNTPTVNSQSTSPGTGTSANDPARLEVVWIESNGTPTGAPNGALAFMGDIAPTGWDTYTNATNRFLRGATGGGNGGGTAASAIASHTHSVDSHTHTGTAHTHTSGVTGARDGTIPNAIGGTGSPRMSNVHSHPVTVNSGTAAALASGSGGTSGGTSPNDPPFINLRARQNTSGSNDLPTGLIGVWRGALGSIPDDWTLCDGTSGTPNVLGRYPRGATASIGTTGGGTAGHTHTGSSHDHTTSGHTHTRTIGTATAGNEAQSGAVAFYANAHTHTISSTDSATPTVTSVSTGTLASQTTEPLHQEVAFIEFQGSIGVEGDEGYGATAAGMVDTPTSVTAQMSWTGGGTAIGVMAVFQLGMVRGVNQATGTTDPHYLVGANR